MAFFDELGKKITDTVDVMGKKTNEVVEVQKLRVQISGLEKNIEKGYVQLGKLVFDKFQNGEALTEEEKAICEEITGNAVLIDEYESEIAEIKGMKKCPGCGAASPVDVAYCPKCGTKMEADVVDAEAVEPEAVEEAEAVKEEEPEDACGAEPGEAAEQAAEEEV